ncbi:MAG TPA: class I SAM-dependent methyltransferase [Pseudogracilibacillus sp.]|nr:class I SAM-dependent methyltransferase [Pseudogracilibacillus sp.]
MKETKVTTLYNWLDETTTSIQNQLDESYLESLSQTLEALFYNGLSDDNQNELLEKTIDQSLTKVDLDNYSVETIRKAIQLALIKAMKEPTQHQHLMTPEAIAMIIGYLATKLVEKHEGKLTVFDPASGSGNLLFVVMEQLKHELEVYASEVDPLLLKLSLHNANLQKKEVEFFHQDSLSPLLLDPVDLVITDLPVGYYPDDVQASNYELKSESGHSYAHHLFIEQSLKHTKPDGFLIFIIPETLFTSDQAESLHKFIQKEAKIVGVLQLPETAFATKEHAKSILILQKNGDSTKEYKQPLLVQLPSLNNAEAMQDILTQMNAWFTQNL